MNEVSKESQDESSKSSIWELHVDGSSRRTGDGTRIVLRSPNDIKILEAVQFSFPTSNNEAKYEALLASLRLALDFLVTHVNLYNDYQLVVSQVTETYEAKNERMAKYLTLVQSMMIHFESIVFEQIP